MIKRFSTIYATGVVVSSMGIIPHTSTEIKACVDAMFYNWLERRGGDTPHEFKTMENDMFALFKEGQNLYFQNAHPKDGEICKLPNEKVGYFFMADGVIKEFWAYVKTFDKKIIKGRDKKAFLPLLAKNGYLKQTETERYTQTKRPKGESSQRFYVIPASAFDDRQEESKKATVEAEKYGVFPPVKL